MKKNVVFQNVENSDKIDAEGVAAVFRQVLFLLQNNTLVVDFFIDNFMKRIQIDISFKLTAVRIYKTTVDIRNKEDLIFAALELSKVE